MIAPAHPAATVVLVRQASSALEVFLVRRHPSLTFMGGVHVFPGGRVDEADRDPAWRLLADGLAAAIDRMPDDRDEALPFHVAAVRETFEESGVLLVRDTAGAPLSSSALRRVAPWRHAVTGGGRGFLDLIAGQHWHLAIDSLDYVAHWVTPVGEVRRFDTRFFLASPPAGQDAAHDAGETVEGRWLRPSEAIAQCRRGEITLAPPTWTTLRWLEAFNDVEGARAWARQQQVSRIEPACIQHGDTRIITLPGDATMNKVEGFEAVETRFLLAGGRWTPVTDDSWPAAQPPASR
jgi:8-oxo-dGTP pyrophosphatase MutT (NUDIX family)